MRLLHTADLHLGKTLKGQPLLDDQIFILDEMFKIIADEKIDVLLIAGDVYDRAIPPPEAVDLFNETLTKLVEKNLPTLIIAGNHDSATRLNFGRKIFERQNIFIAAKVDEPAQVVLADDFGEIFFTPIPYAEPATLAAMIKSARQKIPAGKRSVAIAHAFLTGGIESESERKFVGGSANVDAQIFSGYDYVALGHLHFSHTPKGAPKNIRYAGSPLKYSFDESTHKKSVTVVDIDAQGSVRAEQIPLTPRRDVRIVTGTLADLKKFPRTEDYIHARLTERVINVQDKLADVFPQLLSVEFMPQKNLATTDEMPTARAKGSTLDYFADFFVEQTGEILSDDYREAMRELLIEIARDEREA